MPKLGVQKIQVLLAFGFGLGTQVEKALEDKKITFTDLPGFFDDFMAINDVKEASKEALAEAMDLTPEERNELNAWAQKEFNLANDVVEAKVKATLDFVISTFIFYSVWKPQQ